MKLRVLFLGGCPDRPERALLGALVKHGVGVVVAVEPGAGEELRGSGVEVRELRFNARIDPRAALTVRRWLNAEHFDLIHAVTARSLTAAVLGSLGKTIPIVAYRGTMGNISRFDPSAWLSFLNPKVAGVSCVSQAVCNDLAQYLLTPEHAVTIYKGHDLSWYDGVVAYVRHAMGIGATEQVICCTANMRALKGVDILMRAFAKLVETSELRLLLIGEVRDLALPKLAQELGIAQRVIFTGFRRDALALVAMSDIFVMPSLRREGFPKAVIEAMALARPVVLSDVGGMPEQIVDGESGLVVPAGDSTALANALTRLIQDKKLSEQLGELGRERVRKVFTVESMVDQTLELYGRVCGRGPA